MDKDIKQMEKNISASFSYVKKDMLMLNDAFSDLHDKIQHISLNQATLLEEVEKLRKEVNPKAKKKVGKKKATKKTKSKAKKATKVKKTPKKVVKETTVYS